MSEEALLTALILYLLIDMSGLCRVYVGLEYTLFLPLLDLLFDLAFLFNQLFNDFAPHLNRICTALFDDIIGTSTNTFFIN